MEKGVEDPKGQRDVLRALGAAHNDWQSTERSIFYKRRAKGRNPAFNSLSTIDDKMGSDIANLPAILRVGACQMSM